VTVLDYRQLVFDQDSIRASLRCGSRVTQQLQLPEGEYQAIYLLPLEQCVELMYDPGNRIDQPVLHRVTAPQMAALLIAYCIRVSIPVPRNCDKGINIRADTVSLTFQKRIPA
jgi:hypothetical protein